MAVFLLIGGRFDLDVGANSICIRNIAFELKKRGHDILAITNSWDKDSYCELDGLKIWGVRQTFYDYLDGFRKKNRLLGNLIFKFASLIRRFILIPFYPNVAFLRSIRITKLARKLISQNNVDAVVCFYRPIETLFSALRLKSVYGEKIKVFNYHLDLLTSDSNMKFYSFLRKRVNIFLKRECETVDYLILPESGSGRNINDKIIYTGFPVCVQENKNVPYNAGFSDAFINFVYVGSLDCSNRNPVYAFELIKSFNDSSPKKILLHIWGFIDEDLKRIIKRYAFIRYNGLLENLYSLSVLKQADFILNVGNKNTFLMIPSKIFKSFLSGKPIVNILNDERDVTLKYFEEYGHSLNMLEMNSDKDACYEKFSQFVMLNNGKSFSTPKSLIERNTPEFIVNIIEEKIVC